MVHFVGGASVSGYKAYRNHTIARPGQWRMPRNYGGGSTRVVIKNYNSCSCGSSYGYGGFQLPSWMMWAQFGLRWANQLLGMFMPQPRQPEAPANPLEKQLKEMEDKNKELQRQIDELKKGNDDGNKKVEENDGKATVDGNKKVDNGDGDKTIDGGKKVNNGDEPGEIEFGSQTTGAQDAKEGELKTAEVQVARGKRRADGKVEYQGWRTLQASYKDDEGNTIPWDFRFSFRQEVLGGKDTWELGTQHFPKEFEYNGKKYTFNPDTFAKPIDINDPTKKGNPSAGSTTQKRGEGTAAVAGTTTYSGKVTGSANGKTYTASVTGINASAANSQIETKIALSAELQKQGVSKEDADRIVRNARVKEG